MSSKRVVQFSPWWQVCVFHPNSQDSEIVSEPIHDAAWQVMHSLAIQRLSHAFPQCLIYGERISHVDAIARGIEDGQN